MNGFKKAAMNIKKVTAKTVAGIAGATVAAVAFTAKAVEAASEYETQMQNVATLLDGTSEEIKARTAELGKDIIDVSNATGASTADLTDGMYQVISAFGDTEDAVKILETASKAAVAGNATTTDSINLLSAVTKGYGDTSAEAQQKAADLAFQTVKLGQTSFPELAASMGKVIPLAATMGVKQEELFGAMATLTGVTGGTAEVTTQLRGAVQGFLQPTKEMAAAMKEEVLILGAFGCGAFENNPSVVAKAAKDAVELYKKNFEIIEFAVFCTPDRKENYEAFRKAFA